jgi:hypothetical protein
VFVTINFYASAGGSKNEKEGKVEMSQSDPGSVTPSKPSAGSAGSAESTGSAGAAGAAKPPAVVPEAKPALVAPKPAVVAPKPAVVAPKPAAVVPKPAAVVPKPAAPGSDGSGLPAHVQPTDENKPKYYYVFQTPDSQRAAQAANTEKNYEFTEPVILVSNIYDKSGNELKRTSLESLAPFKTSEIIAVNGYAAMNIIIDILAGKTIPGEITDLLFFKPKSISSNADIPQMQMLFFMFLAQMIFFANMSGSNAIKIQDKSFCDQYDAVRTECIKSEKTNKFFGVDTTLFGRGQKTEAGNAVHEERSWWERNSTGAFLCVNAEVNFADFITIFNQGPSAMLKLMKYEKEITESTDYSDVASQLRELHDYAEVDEVAPERNSELIDGLKETIATIRAGSNKIKPRFENITDLITDLGKEAVKIDLGLDCDAESGEDSDDDDDDDSDAPSAKLKRTSFPFAKTPSDHNERYRAATVIAGPGISGTGKPKSIAGTTPSGTGSAGPPMPAPKPPGPATPAPKPAGPATPAPKPAGPATPAPKPPGPATPAPKPPGPATPAPKPAGPATVSTETKTTYDETPAEPVEKLCASPGPTEGNNEGGISTHSLCGGGGKTRKNTRKDEIESTGPVISIKLND